MACLRAVFFKKYSEYFDYLVLYLATYWGHMIDPPNFNWVTNDWVGEWIMSGLVDRMEDQYITDKETKAKWLSNTVVDSWTRATWMNLIKDSQVYNIVLLSIVTITNYGHQTNYSHIRSLRFIRFDNWDFIPFDQYLSTKTFGAIWKLKWAGVPNTWIRCMKVRLPAPWVMWS